MTKDLYEVLGVDRSASATEIKKAYKQKAKEHHPDKGGDENIFKDIAHAYGVLSDENKKARYDSGGHNALNNQGGFQEDMFRDFFRKQQAQREKNKYAITLSLMITLEDVYNGATKTFKYNRRIKCEPCKGLGGINPSKCVKCHGSGNVTRLTTTPYGQMQEFIPCDDCRGLGVKHTDTCKICSGKGVQISREEETIELPHGISSGETFLLDGKGHMMPNGEFSDLIIRVEVALHEKYHRIQGFNLISKVELPYETLMLGGQIEFETIDGSKVKLSVKELSKIGTKLRLASKGLRKLDWKHSRGDQILELHINLPTSISEEEKELLEKIKKLKE